nr:hypothetical protein [Pirellula sp.]
MNSLTDQNSLCTLTGRFYSQMPIDFCRNQKICVAAAGELVSGETLLEATLLCAVETKPFVVDSVRRALGAFVPQKILSLDELTELIDQQFERFRLRVEQSTRAPSSVSKADAIPISIEGDLLQDQSQAPIIEMVNRILFEAIQQKASDIHFQPLE